MRIAVVHNAIAEGETDPSALDVLEQARFIEEILLKAGHEAFCLPMDQRSPRFVKQVVESRPDCLFNLVESVDGRNDLLGVAAALWEALGIPYTGSDSRALAATTNKALAKEMLLAAGMPTPEWAVAEARKKSWRSVPGPWIVKPVGEDASTGIEDASVVRDPEALPRRVRALRRRFRQPVLVERFIEGREFNLSLLGGRRGLRVLPPAEILFEGFPPGKERIVGFRAKWATDSFEYRHTVRRFDFGADDAPLLGALRRLARRCWVLFDLHGYARVDFRADAEGRPFVIEVNANPCLSPDAGFVAAARRAGISPRRMVQHILEDLTCRATAAR